MFFAKEENRDLGGRENEICVRKFTTQKFLDSNMAIFNIDYSSTKLSPLLRIRETLTNTNRDPRSN